MVHVPHMNFFFLNFNDSFLNHLFDKEHPKDKDIING